MGKKSNKSNTDSPKVSAPEAPVVSTPTSQPAASPALPPAESKPVAQEQQISSPKPRLVPNFTLPVCPPNERPLNTAWSIWFDRRNKVQGENKREYVDNLKHLCCFKSVESFWRYHAFLTKPSKLPKDSNIHLFRNADYPMWESFPNGGCWILKLTKKGDVVDRVWETLVLAAIGEMFEEPDLVGIVLSVRSRQDMIAIWNRDNERERARISIGEKLKQILQLDANAILEYKKHISSMKDNSTYRNAKLYVVGSE
eukprot:c199_g1_i1.p1 GENE.c199_g1_i1~~c199_g1_i1.p1  ORF type:complete len:269 (+),score=39.03 c199_g1_i1:43-807(+)